MQNNNFRGFSSNNRYNQPLGNSNTFQSPFNQFNYQRNQNQNNPLFSNSNNTNNIFTFNNSQQNNNNFPIRINPLSSFQGGNSMNNLRSSSQKKHLYVRLTQEEKGYYSNLFQLVDNQNMGKLKAKDAANFMKKSGLSREVLKNIYLIASQSSKEFLERDEFYVALRLIALAQNNMPYNAQSIVLNRPIPPLPNFNLKKDYLPDNDNLFEMRDDEKVKYKRYFDINKDGNNDNISARKAIQMWRSTGVNDIIIRRIAEILKPNETKGFLNLREFQVATHLINLSDKHEIPTQLPDNLRKYLGRPEINNNSGNNNLNIINLNLNNNNSSNINSGINNANINNSNDKNKVFNSIMSYDFENNNNNATNNQQIAISYPKFDFGNSNNNLNNNNYNYNNNNNNFNNNISSNYNNSNNFNNNNNNPNMREIEELAQKNEMLNNQINMAKNRLNDLLREIDNLQNEQQNIRNQINLMKQRCSSFMSNLDINSNLNINNNINSNNNKINNISNFQNNINNNQNNNSSSNKNYNISLNQSGIGPSKSIIGFNLPQQQQQPPKIEKDSKKEEYERLAKQRQNLLDLMNKMQFDKLIINNNPNNLENTNDNINKNEETKNNINKDIVDIPPEKDTSPKEISPLPDTEKNKTNANKFDDRLLESQAFDPEKLALEIPNPGDDFNFGEEVVNPYGDENYNGKNKKDEFNFGTNSPIGDKQFNFDRPSSVSLGSEIKKMDEENNDKLKANDSNVFNFEYGGNNKNPEKKENKDTFNFNTNDNQKDADEWDF